MQKNQTQTGMDHCASDEVTRAEAELNATYKQLLSKTKKDSIATEKIVKAERLWMQYRDAYLNAMYPAANKQANYGSLYPMEYDLLYSDLTRAQTKRLKKLIRQ